MINGNWTVIKFITAKRFITSQALIDLKQVKSIHHNHNQMLRTYSAETHENEQVVAVVVVAAVAGVAGGCAGETSRGESIDWSRVETGSRSDEHGDLSSEYWEHC